MDDCLIIGGGVIGLSLAYELSGRGAKVHIVERGLIGREASWAGAGILPPGNYRAPQGADEQLARLCSDLHPRWAEQLRDETGIDNGFRRTGGLYLSRTAEEAAALRLQAESWNAAGIRVEMLTPARRREIEPALGDAIGADPHTEVLFTPDEAQLRNPWHLRALRAACVARHVTIIEGATVDDFEISGRRVLGVRTSIGRFSAGTVCITGGAWSRLLLARLGASVGVKPIRGQIALLDCGAPLMRRVINHGRRYLVPRSDGRVLVGSTEEDVGFAKRTTAEAIGGLLQFARALVPALDNATLETSWAGLRPGTPDERPYLGAVPGFENVFVGAGHYRSGLQLSPGTAVVLRQAILGETPDIDLSAFRLDRA